MSDAYTTPKKAVNAREAISKPVLLNGALEGHVLVKNVNDSLPLKKPQLLSVFGYDAVAPSAMDVPFTGGSSTWVLGDEPYPDIPNGYTTFGTVKQVAMNGTMISGGGSGANSPAYISAPFDALQNQVYEDGTSLYWDFVSANPAVDSSSDACLVFINAFATEGYDRPGLHG